MYYLAASLALLAAFLLIVIIMVQNPKGGGLSSSFGSANQMGGVQKTNDFLDKSTWTLAIAIAVLVLISTAFLGKRTVDPTADTGDVETAVSAYEQPFEGFTPLPTPGADGNVPE